MTIKLLICLSVAAIFVPLAFFAWRLTARNAYESAEYTVIESETPFEIREYPDLTMATTNMELESPGDDKSFMRLFEYISGTNDQQQKVAMTTPVFMEPKGQEQQGQMGFVVPKMVAEHGAPIPSNKKIHIRKRAGGRFAVIRFAGRMNSDSAAQAKARLQKWLNEKELVGEPVAEYAGYDPPWTPGPLRRNEVLIRLK